jgi:hypothetical protein
VLFGRVKAFDPPPKDQVATVIAASTPHETHWSYEQVNCKGFGVGIAAWDAQEATSETLQPTTTGGIGVTIVPQTGGVPLEIDGNAQKRGSPSSIVLPQSIGKLLFVRS